MSKLTGKVVIRVDGSVIPTENQAKLNVGGDKRNPEVHGGITYHSDEEQAPMLECTVLQTKKFSAIALTKIENATVLFEADTGQKYIMRQAFTTEPVEFGGNGKAPLKMSGQLPDEV